MDCLFCKIARKELPSDMVYEDDACVGVLDIHPRAPGHTMILPKTHAATILDLPDAAIPGVFQGVKRVTALLEKALAPEGFTIGINHGKTAGQAVDHLHIHVMPRWGKDGGGSVHSVVNAPPKEAIAVMKERILRAAELH